MDAALDRIFNHLTQPIFQNTELFFGKTYELVSEKLADLAQEVDEQLKKKPKVEKEEKTKYKTHLPLKNNIVNQIYDKKQNKELPIFPKEIAAALSPYILGQEMALADIARSIHGHYAELARRKTDNDMDIKPRTKQNLLMIGSTGCGKTSTLTMLSSFLNVPMIIVDGSRVTPAGYVGQSINDWLDQLVAKANGDKRKAETGIIVIDEIDKLVNRSGGNGSHDTFYTSSLQNELLKLIEGCETGSASGYGFSASSMINTHNILWIAMGAFAEANITNKRQACKQIYNYGMIPQLYGRFPNVTIFQPQTKEAFVRMIKDSELSVAKESIKLLASDAYKITLTIDDDAYGAIAESAMNLESGARSLKSVMEYLVAPVLDDAEFYYGQSYILTKEIVEQRLTDLF